MSTQPIGPLKALPPMPTTRFGPHSISRLIVGGNQQNGAAHNNSRALGLHMAEYFTVERTVESLRKCMAQGMNDWQANYNQKTSNIVSGLREVGEDISLISLSTPSPRDPVTVQTCIMMERIESTWMQMMELKPIGRSTVIDDLRVVAGEQLLLACVPLLEKMGLFFSS